MNRNDFPTRHAYAQARAKHHRDTMLYQGFRTSYGSRSRAQSLSRIRCSHGELARRWEAVALAAKNRGA